MRITLAALSVCAIIGIVFLWLQIPAQPQPEIADGLTRITLGDTTITADIVDTVPERQKGLSGRTSLDDVHGMLFVFQEDGQHVFWMKDMLISIDIIWLSVDKQVIHIVQNATPESYPELFRPDGAARYVLEVPAGWAERHSVVLGSVATF